MMDKNKLDQFCDFDEAREIIHQAGGILQLAHVGLFVKDLPPAKRTDVSLVLIRDLMACGLDGFELYHPANICLPGFEAPQARADRLGCPISGGSDFHHAPGSGVKMIGSSQAPSWIVERVDTALAQHTKQLA